MRYFEIPPLKIPAVSRELLRVQEGFPFSGGGLRGPPGPPAQRGLPDSGKGFALIPVFSGLIRGPRFSSITPGFYPGFGRLAYFKPVLRP